MVFPNLHLADENFVKIIPAGGDMHFEETKEGGEGVSVFKAVGQALQLRVHDRPPLVWALKNKKCADGAFLTFSEKTGGYTLHILEMKSKITVDEFCKVLEQFKGMYFSAISMMSVLRMPAPSDVRFYISYKRCAIEESSPVLLKQLTGVKSSLGLSSWVSETVHLPFEIQGKLIKGVRVDGKNCDFGTIH